MVGIHSTRSLGASGGRNPDLSHNNLHFDGRAAPNLGIYNRVCHREQEAKRGYKFAAFLINGCLGTQIVVAAALTAMGAAGSNHVGITAFGAINTVIAGILTYLKGSGLPNRIRYYENEWKKVREYIEQRERDFSRPDCRLDVYEVVRAIESMYEECKADVQSNYPDNYISVGDIRNRSMLTAPHTPKLANGMGASKIQELELKYGPRIADLLEGLAHKEEDRLKHLEKAVGDEFDTRRSRAVDIQRHLEKDLEAGTARAVGAGRGVEAALEDARERAVRDVRDLEKEAKAEVSRAEQARTDVERETDRQRSNVMRLGRDVDEIRRVRDDWSPTRTALH
ncbi:hypothetical protein K491DRAFT_599913 [Lophiostoma macrostomum CBS 122681]|uniref:SMODS and SLOG-associating 2TM effector domain-containing protein n=1 Tax=Lophiostoma macrostomum CBS 122681 TaxID=1314788 RepID=A0A6A6T500_9PLEO|nr:hypothetical protein K491DRAFT_599913 [Lophiostoma macrostomum CBS 122681]